jgi:biopolymer transport protein ExbD
MAMNVGSPDDDGEEQMNNTINTTPLVDVMLVLLIIFLITIPVVTQTIKLRAAQGTQPAHADQAREHRAGRQPRWRGLLGHWSACPTSRAWWPS